MLDANFLTFNKFLRTLLTFFNESTLILDFGNCKCSMERVETLGDAIRTLLKRRDLNQKELADKIGINPVSLNRIIQGHAKPRQVTFTRLCKELAIDNAETQILVKYFTGACKDLPEAEIELNEANERFELERVERFMEMKAQSIAFRKTVARELDKAGMQYKQEYVEGIYVADFLVEIGKKRIAIECRFNVQRDFDRAVLTAKLLREKLGCDKVITVVPCDIGDTVEVPRGFTVVTPGELVGELGRANLHK